MDNGYIRALEGEAYTLHNTTISDAPSGPGLGIVINEDLVREAAAAYAKEKPWRNEVWHGADNALREW